jgi:hypothetical protein
VTADGRPEARAGLRSADLVGTWLLRSWTAEGDDGSVLQPMGDHPEGILVYASDGTMITTIGEPDRSPIDGGDMLAGPLDQRLAALSSFIAYAGTYRVDGDDVVHAVTMSLFPNWIGTEQRRHVELAADRRTLTLSADPFVLRGRRSAQRLAWERAGR